MGRFKQTAQESMILSRLHKDKESADTALVASKSKQSGLTVEDFDMVQRDDGVSYAVFTFKELPGYYYNTGIVGTKLVMAWTDMVGGDVEDAADAYKKEDDPIKLRFKEEKCKTDKTKNVTTVEVL